MTPLRRIDSPANATVKRLRALDDRRHRRAEGLFLAEGLRMLTEALDSGRAPAVLLLSPDAAAHPLGRRVAAATLDTRGEAAETTPAVLSKVTGRANPAGAVAAYPLWDTALARLDAATAAVWCAAEGLRDPGNLGTILRACDGAGAGGLVLVDGGADPFGVEAVRASMGAIFTVPVATTTAAEFLAWARTGACAVAGALLSATTIDYRAARWPERVAILLGNEQSGLPEALANACDMRVGIPMRGHADSLNVAMAATVLLYEATRGGG